MVSLDLLVAAAGSEEDASLARAVRHLKRALPTAQLASRTVRRPASEVKYQPVKIGRKLVWCRAVITILSALDLSGRLGNIDLFA